ncbi:MAG: hypothetical protein WCC66_16210 [Rhizobiaceae bacterium]
MPGPETHSKKPKAVTIDLTANAEPDAAPTRAADLSEAVVNEAEPAAELPEMDRVSEAKSETVSDTGPQVAPVHSGPESAPSGFVGKLGAGLLGGLVALLGAAGLQYAGQLPSFGSGAEVAVLKEDIARLSSVPAFDPSPLVSGQQAIKDEIAALNDRVAATPSSGVGADAVKALEDRLAALESKVSNLPVSGASVDPAAAGVIKALSDKVAVLESAQPAAGGASAVALAIAASGLKAAIDRGGPFMAELETYATVAPASPDIEDLRTLAAKGVPSRQDLVNGFDGAATAILTAAQPANPDASLWERLTQSAKNIVKARPVGEIAGDSPEAVVARMEVSLGRGDLDNVLAEAGKLPAEAQTVGATYLDQVKARRDTDALVSKALQLALTAAGGKL